MILNLHQFEYTVGAESSMAEWNWRQSTAWWEIIGAWLSLAHNSALIFQKILNIMNTFGQGFSAVLLGESLFWPDCLGPAGHSFLCHRELFLVVCVSLELTEPLFYLLTGPCDSVTLVITCSEVSACSKVILIFSLYYWRPHTLVCRVLTDSGI